MQPIPVQLSVRNVRKSFSGKAGGVRVLDDLSFSINERDFVSIIGPSGCGKTTIFNIIAIPARCTIAAKRSKACAAASAT